MKRYQKIILLVGTIIGLSVFWLTSDLTIVAWTAVYTGYFILIPRLEDSAKFQRFRETWKFSVLLEIVWIFIIVWCFNELLGFATHSMPENGVLLFLFLFSGVCAVITIKQAIEKYREERIKK